MTIMSNQLPARVMENDLQHKTWRLGIHLKRELELRHNMAGRLAVWVVNGDILTPGYLSNRELYCWFSGVWLRYDRKDLYEDERLPLS